jgi:hypothetical protein
MIENFSKGILGEEAYPSPACARKRVCRAKEEEDLKIDACYNVLALIVLTLGTKRHLCIHILSEACFAASFPTVFFSSCPRDVVARCDS